jgi:hypothetical protein
MVKKPTPNPAKKRPANKYEMFCAPVCRPPPRTKTIHPAAMVQRRPNLSPDGPAKAAPKKAPAVKRETTTPLKENNQHLDTGHVFWLVRNPYVSLDVGLNLALKVSEATTSAITPRS